MAVPEGERRPCKMDVFMHELDLVTYTLQITRNEKIFLPRYCGNRKEYLHRFMGRKQYQSTETWR
jgi:hypothetical protein